MLALVEGGEGVGEVVADHAGAGDSPSCCHFRRRSVVPLSLLLGNKLVS